MPELPEVETTRRGIAPHLEGQTIARITVRQSRLRWPVPDELALNATGQRIIKVTRRAKYLLIALESGSIMIHLGMSGTLRILTEAYPPEKHEHIDLQCSNGCVLRYRDPRRFGSWLWITPDAAEHPLLQKLGPEPLDPESFHADYLYPILQRHRQAIKPTLMDNHVVVGVGNIYASEALFRAAIDPRRPASSLSPTETRLLVSAVRDTLNDALLAGGSTLRDYVDSAGNSGYFMLNSQVYGRVGETCRRCGASIQQIRQGQRSTCFCPGCQL